MKGYEGGDQVALIKHFLVVDFESYYDQDFSLRKISPPEYILGDKFKTHIMGVWDPNTWLAPRTFLHEEIPGLLADYPAADTAMVSHNALFDMSILSWRYGYVPRRMLCTMSMARALYTLKSYSLGNLASALFGHNPKGDIIHKVKGMGIADIKQAGLWPVYNTYCMNDVRICWHIFQRLYAMFPVEEQIVLDLVLRCAVEPVLEADIPLLTEHLVDVRRKKAALLSEAGREKTALMSTAQFRTALERLGVEIAYKASPRDPNKFIPAFSKTDAFMSELLSYCGSGDDDVNWAVQTLAAARLNFKSTIEETRAERFVTVASQSWPSGRPLMPIPLRYGGAHTHRLAGDWQMNMQNLTRDQKKSKLRTSLRAPRGCKILAPDLSQIEARIVATLAGQDDLIAAFAAGVDVYAEFASVIFGHPVNKKDHPVERFVGKTGILGLGYGCGHERFFAMVTAQARQNNISLAGLFDKETAERTVQTYRSRYAMIPRAWYVLDGFWQKYINGPGAEKLWPDPEYGPLLFKPKTIVLPNDLTLRYTGDEKLWGGVILENATQALARVLIMQVAVRLSKRGYRFVMQAHDELMYVVDATLVDESKAVIMEEMTRRPAWLPELPVAAEIGVGDTYAESK